MPVRAIYRALQAAGEPPYNTITVKFFYPAVWSDDETARVTGVMPPDDSLAPFPVMLFFPGVNCESAMYYWLAQAIAADGVAVAVMSWVAQNLPGRVSLTPGIDLKMASPDCYGTGFTATSLPPLLEMVQALNAEGIFAGKLDMNRIILAGHSAGGTLALQNADKRYLPGIAGSIAYCANPLATSILAGFAKGELPPLPAAVPTLMIGATEDGIGTHHNAIYGRPHTSGADTIQATFTEVFARHAGDSACVIVRGANHYSIASPLDQTTGRAFLDTPETADSESLRAFLSELIRTFIRSQILKDETLQSYWKHLLETSSAITTVLVK